MKVRRKSLWRSLNNKRAKFRANQRAAKECRRMERAAREDHAPESSVTIPPKPVPPLFVISIRCRDGERVTLPIRETPFGLSTSATLAAQKIFHILSKYRPVAA